MSTKFKKRILSIDGGGIRGIIPACVLNYIEERTGQRIATMFDGIAGTSTGGILALGLTKRNSDMSSNHEPEYTAAELLHFYRRYGRKIFNEYIPTAVDDPLQPKFNPQGRLEVLEDLLGEAKLEDALKPVFVPSYDIELRVPIFFTSDAQAEENDGLDGRKVCRGFRMVDAAMATSAAPTFFPPYKLETVHRTAEGYYALIDGGMFANNPASLVMMETMIAYKRDYGEELNRENILLVSIGTGSLTRKYSYKEARGWGQLKWVLPILNVVIDGQSEAVAYQLAQLLINCGETRNYYRFQVPLSSDDGHDQMDNASLSNIEYLEDRGQKLIAQRKDSLDQLCRLLMDES